MREIDFAFYSDAGGRIHNEDCYIAKKIDDDWLFIVADGLGGYNAGEVASRMAVDTIKEYLMENKTDIEGAVKLANELILEKQQFASSSMKTTLALVFVSDKKTVFAHMGDSRIYAFKEGNIVFQSLDHSVSQFAVCVGDITPEQQRTHPDRNVITRALGVNESVKPDISELCNDQYDSLLLCSDGFWEYVFENEMEESLRTSKASDIWLYKMRNIQLLRAPEKCDNNTAVAIMTE